MKKFFLILLFISVSIFCIHAQNENSYKSDINNTKQMVIFFNYINHFEWIQYYDQNIGYVYDSTEITHYNTTDTNNIWQVCFPNKGIWTDGGSQPSADTFPSKALLTDSVNSYPNNNVSELEFHVVKPQWATILNLCWSHLTYRFKYKCDTDTLKDGLLIYVSFDGGNSFENALDTTLVKSLPNAPDIINYTSAYNNMSLLGDSFGLTGSNVNFSNGWGLFDLDYVWDNQNSHLVDYAILRLTFKSDSINSNKLGFMIDAVSISVTDECFVSVENSIYQYSVKLYPNPISEASILEFSNPNCEDYKLEIVDVNGKSAYESETNNQNFNIGSIELTKGIYYYRLSNTFGVVKIDKFVKS
jgi:hypothetical protein